MPQSGALVPLAGGAHSISTYMWLKASVKTQADKSQLRRVSRAPVEVFTVHMARKGYGMKSTYIVDSFFFLFQGVLL